MSRQVIVWADVQRYFSKHNFIIKSRGGEKIIVAAVGGDGPRSRNQVVIGHKSCNSHNSRVLPCYLNQLENAFDVTRDDILNG